MRKTEEKTETESGKQGRGQPTEERQMDWDVKKVDKNQWLWALWILFCIQWWRDRNCRWSFGVSDFFDHVLCLDTGWWGCKREGKWLFFLHKFFIKWGHGSETSCKYKMTKITSPLNFVHGKLLCFLIILTKLRILSINFNFHKNFGTWILDLARKWRVVGLMKENSNGKAGFHMWISSFVVRDYDKLSS